MEMKTNAANRKDVVKALSEFLGVPSEYQGPPTFGYTVGEATVDREGNVHIEDEGKGEEIRIMLTEKGLMEAEGTIAEISIPLTNHTMQSIKNLIYMIHSKQYLLGKAVGRENLKVSDKLIERLETEEILTRERVIEIIGEEETEGIRFSEDAIHFGGFPTEGNSMEAYCDLVARMAKASITSKRVNPKPTIVENEKYYMRVWLVRLGLDGKAGEATRREILKNLKGHTAFKDEAAQERWKEQQKARKQNATSEN